MGVTGIMFNQVGVSEFRRFIDDHQAKCGVVNSDIHGERRSFKCVQTCAEIAYSEVDYEGETVVYYVQR